MTQIHDNDPILKRLQKAEERRDYLQRLIEAITEDVIECKAYWDMMKETNPPSWNATRHAAVCREKDSQMRTEIEEYEDERDEMGRLIQHYKHQLEQLYRKDTQ